MQVSELKAGTGKVDIVLEVVEKDEPRGFEKFGKQGRVCNAKGKDSAGGIIKVTLWNEQVDLVQKGGFIKITNGYVGEFKGELQLSTGKFGKLETAEGFE